ncbi:GTP-binding protein [Streptosporangium lutulentum]
MSTPVVLVAGLHAQARATVVDRLLEDHPGAVAIHHDLREVTRGRVERVTRDASDVLDRTEVRLAHGCVTCTVREDLVPELLRHAATAPLLIAELWDSVEPRSVAEALDGEEVHGTLRLTAVLTALDAEHMPVDICRGDRLAETGMRAASGDERYLAEVLARQIEYATGLLLHLGDGDDEDVELSRAVLGHLAPNTPAPSRTNPCPSSPDPRSASRSSPPASTRPPPSCPATPGPGRSARSCGTGSAPAPGTPVRGRLGDGLPRAPDGRLPRLVADPRGPGPAPGLHRPRARPRPHPLTARLLPAHPGHQERPRDGPAPPLPSSRPRSER